MIKNLSFLFVLVVFFTPFFVFGQSVSLPEIKAQDFLRQLEDELSSLQRKDFLVRWGGEAVSFQRNLTVGSPLRGDVLRLQAFLAMRGYLNPSFQTGYFYGLTRRAAQKYQADKRLPMTGYVGPLTRKALDQDFEILILELRQKDFNAAPTSTLPAVVTVVGDTVYQKYDPPVYDAFWLEQRVFEGINRERETGGLGKLQWSNDLAVVARMYGNNLAIENRAITDPTKPCVYPFIHHEDLITGGGIGDRLKNANIVFKIAGENIAIMPLVKQLSYQLSLSDKQIECPRVSMEKPVLEWSKEEKARFLNKQLEERVYALKLIRSVQWVSQTWNEPADVARTAVQGWMDSPGHRENILQEKFAETGIGVVFVNDYVIFMQVFLTR